MSCQIQLFRDSFTKMDRLRLLKVFTQSWNYYKVDYPAVPVDFELSSSELKLLHFEKYPLKSLPTNFDGNNLVELNLRGSRIKQLWKENEVLLLVLLLLLLLFLLLINNLYFNLSL